MHLFRARRYGSIRTNARRANSTQNVRNDLLWASHALECVPWDVPVDSLGFLRRQPRSSFATTLAFHLTWERWMKGTKLGSESVLFSGRIQHR